MAFDSAGVAWVLANNYIYRIADPTSPGDAVNQGFLPSGFIGTGNGIAFDADGSLWVTSGMHQVWEIPDPTSPGTGTNHGILLPGPQGITFGITFDADGHLWVVDVVNGWLIEAADPSNPAGAVSRGLLPANLQRPTGISIDQETGSAWIVDDTGDELWEIPDPTSPGTGTNHGALPSDLGIPRGVFALRIINPIALEVATTAAGTGFFATLGPAVSSLGLDIETTSGSGFTGRLGNLISIIVSSAAAGTGFSGSLRTEFGFEAASEAMGTGFDGALRREFMFEVSTAPGSFWSGRLDEPVRIEVASGIGSYFQGSIEGAPTLMLEAESGNASHFAGIIVGAALTDDRTPILPQIQNKTFSQGVAIDEVLPPANGGNGDLTYNVVGVVPGIHFSGRSYSGNASTFGVYPLTYRATDEDGSYHERQFFISVGAPTPPAMVLPPVADRTWFVGDEIDETLPVARGGVGAKTYSLLRVAAGAVPVAATPSGLAFDPANDRRVRGRLREPGVQIWRWRGEDEDGLQRDRDFMIDVRRLAPVQTSRPGGSVESRIALYIEPVGSPGDPGYRQGFAWWNGVNDLVLGGVRYRPGEVLGLSDYEVDMQREEPITVYLEGADPLFRAWLIRPSVRDATVTFLLRIDNGEWEPDLRYVGQVGEALDEGNRYSLDVDSARYLPSQAGVTRQSDESQRSIYPDDRIYENQARLPEKTEVWPG
ncbi:hypothetical protein [Candidatus Poriferisodalis sp.]|uniref:hypothetical protein n=1 Tax=Candidatus Poriferisodalis sp. TaxID=3101277 RepID=UPI003B02668A